MSLQKDDDRTGDGEERAILDRIACSLKRGDTPQDRRRDIDDLLAICEVHLKASSDARTLLEAVESMLRRAQATTSITAEQMRQATGAEEVRNALELSALYRAEAACLVSDFWSATGFRRHLYSRMVVIAAYETAHSLRDLLGLNLRTAVAAKLGDVVEDDLCQVHSQVCKLDRRYRKEFRNLRDGLVAHRDQDGRRRAQLYTSTDSAAAVAAAVELFHPLTLLNRALSPYMERSLSDLRVLAEQLFAELDQARR